MSTMDYSLANVAVMKDMPYASHSIAPIKHRPYDTVVDSEDFLDYSHDKSDSKMFNETRPSFSDWNYSQNFPAHVPNIWSSYHLASSNDQFEYRFNSSVLDTFGSFNPKSTSESNSLDSWFPEMLKLSPNDSYLSNTSATAASTDFLSSFVNTHQEMPKVESRYYPFHFQDQQQVVSEGDSSGDRKEERSHQCVQCSRYYASLGGLKRHLKVCRVSSAESQPYFNSLNQMNTTLIPALQHYSFGNNSLPVDLSFGGNEADNRKLKSDSVPVPNIQRSDVTRMNSENPSAFTAVVSVLQPRNRLNSHHVCPMCPQVVSSEKKLIAHMITHNVSKPFVCKTCSSQFSRKYHLTRHMKQKGCDGTPKVEFPCTICDRRFTRKDNLREHMIKSHPNPEAKKVKVNCPFPGCKKEFNGLAQMESHFNSHTKQRQFQCDNSQCDKSFGSRATLIRHKLTHNGEKLHSCSQCHQCFSSPDELNHHMVSFHGENVPVQMDQQETVSNVGLHACYDCDKRFSSSQELKIHVVEHKISPGQHSVTCGVCKVVLKDWYELQVHFDTQHYSAQTLNIPTVKQGLDVSESAVNPQARQYDCDICAETFTCKLLLKSHILSHVKQVSDGPNGSYQTMNTSGFQYANSFGNASAAQTLPSQNKGNYSNIITDGFDTSRFERNIIELLGFLVDPSALMNFGWPRISVDSILQSVLEKCGKMPLTSNFYSSLNERLQGNAKILFSFIIDDPLALENLFARRSIENVLEEVISLARSKSK